MAKAKTPKAKRTSSKKNPAAGKFSNLQVALNASTPEQIQMRIMWITLQRLIIAAFGDSPVNRKILKNYDDKWKVCDAEIAKRAKQMIS